MERRSLSAGEGRLGEGERSRRQDDSEGGWSAFLVVGDTPVARRVCATLCAQHGSERVQHLVSPSDAELSAALEQPVTFATVLLRDDVAALRCALALAHLDSSLPVAVTVFDRTIAAQLQTLLPDAIVTSSAAAAIPSLLGPCLRADVLASFEETGHRVEVTITADGVLDENHAPVGRHSMLPRAIRWLRFEYRNQDPGTRILLKGLLGLVLVLVADWIWLVVASHQSPGLALTEAARVVATVGPAAEGAGPYALFSSVAMLVTIVLTAMFTAGLVDRLLQPRLIGLSGSGAVPRNSHVIVVGLGQVGLRLCEQLRARDVPVVAVERNRDARYVDLARLLGIPVVIGDGASRHLLERLALTRCRAVAAVGSDDLDNVAVAVAVSAISPATRVVLRAGEQEAVSETRSLLPLGTTRDVTAIGAAAVLAQISRRTRSIEVVAHEDQVWLRNGPFSYGGAALARRDACRHADTSLHHIRSLLRQATS